LKGAEIKELRKKLSLSQHGFANKIGYSQSSVTNWENDYTEIPQEAVEIIEELEEVSYNQAVK
jgi:DNA-binding transcriptional regulator YiaG